MKESRNVGEVEETANNVAEEIVEEASENY